MNLNKLFQSLKRFQSVTPLGTMRVCALLAIITVINISCGLFDSPSSDNEYSGDYEATKYLSPGPTDGLEDVLSKGVSLKLTLTGEQEIQNGHFVYPDNATFEECPPMGEQEVRFGGDYTVSEDTLTFYTDEDCTFLNNSKWVYQSGKLSYAVSGFGAPEIVLSKE